MNCNCIGCRSQILEKTVGARSAPHASAKACDSLETQCMVTWIICDGKAERRHGTATAELHQSAPDAAGDQQVASLLRTSRTERVPRTSARARELPKQLTQGSRDARGTRNRGSGVGSSDTSSKNPHVPLLSSAGAPRGRTSLWLWPGGWRRPLGSNRRCSRDFR